MIFNFLGAGMLGGCMFVGYGLCALLGVRSDDAVIVVAGPLMFVCDLWYRLTRPPAPAWNVAAEAYRAQAWFHHHQGGQLLFVPVWACGLVLMAGGMFDLLIGR